MGQTPVIQTPEAFLVQMHRETADRAIVINKFGRNTDVGTGAEEDVWETGGSVVYPAAAAVASVAFSGNDSSTGTHARKITIQGLDASWDFQSEEVTLTAAGSPVSSTGTWFRVDRSFVSEVGAAGNTNENAITVSVGGNVQATIGAGLGQTLRTQYTVPRNHTAYLRGANISIESTKTVNYRMLCRDRPDDATKIRAWRTLHTGEGTTGIQSLDWGYSIAIAGPCDVRWAALGITTAGKVDIDYTFVCIHDDVVVMDGQI